MIMHSIAPASRSPLVIVDPGDKVIAHGSWQECHRGEGLLHRAVSVFLFDPAGNILLQRRSALKPLWPLYWSNACCTHPMPGEPYKAAADRRLREELGVETRLIRLFKFSYHARSGAWSERELCAVFAGVIDQPITADKTEVSEWRWVHPAALDAELDSASDSVTPWAIKEWALIRRLLGRRGELGVEAR